MTTLCVQPAPLDFMTTSGAPKGHRHRRLAQLAIAHFARGEDAEAVEALALQWAARCEPPLEDAEVLKIVASLATKHSTSLPPEGQDDLEAIPLPERPPWPVLDPSALHGPAGDIVRTLEAHTEADPVGLLVSSLVALGNCIGREPYFPVEGDLHHVNLFSVLVGDSSRGRKGTSLGRVLSLFDTIDNDWKQSCLATGLSSGEGLIWAVHDAVEAVEPIKEKGAVTGYQVVVKDPGVEDKRLLVNESEFAQALRVLRREGNTLSPIIRQAWDKGDMKALTKNSLAKATDAHISILGHITQPELVKYLGDTDCFNGFANRFLWVIVRRSKLLPDGGQQVNLQPLKERLARAVASAKEIGAMSRDTATRNLWYSLYSELTAERPGLYGAVTGRAEAQVLRLSMLYALLDGTATVSAPHLQAAASLWRYCDMSARLIFAGDIAETVDPLEAALLGAIRRQPGINRKGLHKTLGGHVAAAQMVQALARLRDRGTVRPETVQTRGRPSECWFPQTLPVVLTSDIRHEVVPPAETDGDGSLARTTPSDPPKAESVGMISNEDTSLASQEAIEAVPLPLIDLFAQVRAAGGKIVRSGDAAFTVQGVNAAFLTPAILAALETHRDELALVVPTPSVFDPELASPSLAEDDGDHLVTPENTDDPFILDLLRTPEFDPGNVQQRRGAFEDWKGEPTIRP